MKNNHLLSQLTFSEDNPVKTVLLEQEHFGLVRIALGKGVKIPPHQGAHAVFFLVLKGRGIFTWGEEELELSEHQYLHVKAYQTRGILALEDLVVFVVKG